MRKWIKTLAVTSAIATALAAPALYAHESEGSGGSMMGSGMMGMMGMMQQMSGMMEGCGKMMQSSNPGSAERPNEQWREDAPQDSRTPDTNG